MSVGYRDHQPGVWDAVEVKCMKIQGKKGYLGKVLVKGWYEINFC